MRFTQRLRNESITQWKPFYLNYGHLKSILKIIRNTVRERQQLETLRIFKAHTEARTKKTISFSQMQIPKEKEESMQRELGYFVQNSNQINQLFLESLEKSIELYGRFTKWKYLQIETNFNLSWKLHFYGEGSQKLDENIILPQIEYLFVQSFYLTKFVETNVQAERKILAKHSLYANGVFSTLQPRIENYVKIDACHLLRRQIQRFYFRISKKSKDENREKLRKLAQKNIVQPNQTLLIGILVGVVLAVITFMSILLQRSSITLEKDSKFNSEFVLWRGIGIFIFYIWVLGLDFWYFEKYKISTRSIFKNNQTSYPKSTDLFRLGGVFSLIFMITFSTYSLSIVGILQSSLKIGWLPLFSWGALAIFIFNPFPVLYAHGRMFFFKMVFDMIMSVVFVVQFHKIFMAAQALSMLNVFQDLSYTICYYINIQQNEISKICKNPSVQARFIYTIFIYIIRIVQTIKLGYGQEAEPNKIQYINSFKFSLALLTAILSYVWKDTNNQVVFPAWLTFAIISTLFSFIWEIKVGWDLMDFKSANCLLRDKLLFPKLNYYIWIILNFLLRVTWTLNISPNVIGQVFRSPELITFIFGCLQIARRGIWTVLRVEVQQIKKNQAFEAFSNQKQKMEKLMMNSLDSFKQTKLDFSTDILIQSQKVMIETPESKKQELKKEKVALKDKVNEQAQLEKKQKVKIDMMQKQVEDHINYLMSSVY